MSMLVDLRLLLYNKVNLSIFCNNIIFVHCTIVGSLDQLVLIEGSTDSLI